MLRKNLMLIEEMCNWGFFCKCVYHRKFLHSSWGYYIFLTWDHHTYSVAGKTVLIEISCEVILRFRTIVLLRTYCCCNLIKFIHNLIENNGAVLNCICRRNFAVKLQMNRTVLTTTARMQELTYYAVILTANAVKYSVIIMKQLTSNVLWNLVYNSICAVVMLEDQL